MIVQLPKNTGKFYTQIETQIASFYPFYFCPKERNFLSHFGKDESRLSAKINPAESLRKDGKKKDPECFKMSSWNVEQKNGS